MRLSRLLCVVMLLAGCVPPPPDNLSDVRDVRRAAQSTLVLSQNSTQRYARNITYRVRNPSCRGVASGSAFAISKDTLVTNRHVVQDGAMSLEISTWDGRDALISVSHTTLVADLAFIKTYQELPIVASIGKDPQKGDRVAAVGYPLGGPWTLSQGSVLGYFDGAVYGIDHETLVFDAKVQPGNSGGPLLDRDGNVVGVVFAKESEGDRNGLAIPVSLLKDVMRSGVLQTPTLSCQ